MAITQLKTFAAVQQFIAQVLQQNHEDGSVGFSPHKAFWQNMTYDQFVDGTVPGVKDPNDGSQCQSS